MISKLVGLIKNITFYERFAFIETLDNRYYKLIRYSLSCPSGYDTKAWKEAVKDFINRKEEISLVIGKDNKPYVAVPNRKVNAKERTIVLITGIKMIEVSETDVMEILIKGFSEKET
ncbi:MAG TPA: hypothetical protein P5136_02635 [Methanofastidiosum sp.]|nr:hypothetical protein [Methanofastidiosum sp.]